MEALPPRQAASASKPVRVALEKGTTVVVEVERMKPRVILLAREAQVAS